MSDIRHPRKKGKKPKLPKKPGYIQTDYETLLKKSLVGL